MYEQLKRSKDGAGAKEKHGSSMTCRLEGGTQGGSAVIPARDPWKSQFSSSQKVIRVLPTITFT